MLFTTLYQMEFVVPAVSTIMLAIGIKQLYEILHLLQGSRNEIQQLTKLNQESIHRMYQEMADNCNREEIIDALQQQICLQAMPLPCNHEETIAALQQELFEANNHIASLYEQSSACNHEPIIAYLQLELYYAKQKQSSKKEKPTNYHNRIESILLEKIDSTGIPDQNILQFIRTFAPRLRRNNLYDSLHSLQRRGLIMERPDKVWVRVLS